MDHHHQPERRARQHPHRGRGHRGNDVWAVGSYFDNTAHQATLALHWDGTQWTLVPTVDTGVASNLVGVAGVAANDVWAAGSYADNSGNLQTLTEHWNGSALDHRQ